MKKEISDKEKEMSDTGEDSRQDMEWKSGACESTGSSRWKMIETLLRKI